MGKKIFVAATLIAAMAAWIWAALATDPVRELKNNKNEQLICSFENGERVIPKNKIVAYVSDVDAWSFTNGSARNCRIVKIGR